MLVYNCFSLTFVRVLGTRVWFSASNMKLWDLPQQSIMGQACLGEVEII